MRDIDVQNIEAQDFDIIENALVALQEVWKKKILVLLISLAGFLVALLLVSIMGNSVRYYSSATLFSAAYGSYNDTNEGVAVMNRYSDLIGSSRVCSRAAQALAKYNITVEELQEMVKEEKIWVTGANTNSVSYGYKLKISAISDSKEMVLDLVNAMASAFASELNDLIGASVIQVMDEATEYGYFNTVNTVLYLLVFPVGAFVVSCGILFLLTFFSPWVRSVAQCEQDDDLILGLLPYVRNK